MAKFKSNSREEFRDKDGRQATVLLRPRPNALSAKDVDI